MHYFIQCGPCSMTRPLGRFLSWIVELRAALSHSIVSSRSSTPKIILSDNFIFDQVIRPCVSPFPFTLNRPSAVVRYLKARLRNGSWEKRLPLLALNNLLHNVIYRRRKNSLTLLGAYGGSSDLRFSVTGKQCWPNMLEVKKPSSLVKPIVSASRLWLCLRFL